MDCIDDYRKIVGPDSCQVKPHSKPWMANIVRRFKPMFKHRCGGVLIGTRLVLTASHCICAGRGEGYKVNCTGWKYYLVILGDHDSKTHSMATKGQLGTRNSLEEQEIEITYGETDPKWNGKLTDIIRIIHIQRYNTSSCLYRTSNIIFMRSCKDTLKREMILQY